MKPVADELDREKYNIPKYVNAYIEHYKKRSFPFEVLYLQEAYEYFIYEQQLNETWDQKKYFKAIDNINRDSLYQMLHKLLNNLILVACSKNLPIKNTNIFSSLSKKVINEIKMTQNTFKKLKLEPRSIMNSDEAKFLYWSIEHKLFDEDSILLTAIKRECIAHEKNAWLLYRGTGPQKNNKNPDSTIKEEKLYSISYGNSLLAGFLRECSPRGAMAYSYMKQKNNGYNISLDKKDYLSQAKGTNIFFIPPISSILGLNLEGENFHPRTKIPAKSKRGTKGIVEGESILHIEHLKINLTSKEIEKTFQKFLKTNSKNF